MVSRLCAPIEGTDAARLADCLGLDVSKYRGSASGEATADELREEALLASAASLDDDALYKVPLSKASPPDVNSTCSSQRVGQMILCRKIG